MGKIQFLKDRIEEMRQIEIEIEGQTWTIGELAQKEAKSIRLDNATLALVTTALAMRSRWYETAKPRVESYRNKYPHIRDLSGLQCLLDSMSEKEFCRKVLGYSIRKTPFWRYQILRGLVKGFCEYKQRNEIEDDWEAMQDWARTVDIDNIQKDLIGRIRNVNIATVQNLRLLCGVDTVKPDVHIKRVLEKIGLGNEVGIVELLAEVTGYPSLELDQIFWHWDKQRSD